VFKGRHFDREVASQRWKYVRCLDGGVDRAIKGGTARPAMASD
jgi:hypothetical protein